MRYLNRVIFINSARIRYSEINVNGNVHFIGTQGVGKSTLLRAILFFYNADTSGLGIPKSKASYTDYYFKDSNSYIIYEVERDGNKFCVVSYKSQHKVCFRFFDAEYDKKYFINENGSVPEAWDGIASELDKNRIFYTKRKIEEHKEYRDILYGNHDGKKAELKRYSILESKEYQYIPKTIQNVLLNSKMEAEFIKQTIIMSLDNDYRIDLNQHAHHLNGFESQLFDIKKFKTPGATAQAEEISKLYIVIKSLERERIQIVKQLAWAIERNSQEEPELGKRLEKQKSHEAVLTDKLDRLQTTFNAKADKIKGDIRIQDDNLKKVKSLTEDYLRKNIDAIISRVEKKGSLEGQQKKLLDEKELLTTQFKELAQKFQALLDQLDNQHRGFLNGKEAEKNRLNLGFINYQTELRKGYDKQIADLKADHRKEIETAREVWEQKKRDTKLLEIDKSEIKHKRFFEDEIQKLESEIRTFGETAKDLTLQNANLNREIESIQKNWFLDEEHLQKNLERDREKFEQQIAESSRKIFVIEEYISSSKDSLYGWLTEQYPGWENTIGKIIDETTVLFSSSLSPRLTNKTNNFYGVEINLDEINKTVKTVDDYEKEKVDLKEEIDGLRKSISLLLEKFEGDRNNLKRKYQPKIREKKDLIKENEYLIGQHQSKRNESTIRRNALVENAQSEKQLQLEKYEVAIRKATAAELEAEGEVKKLESELEKSIKAKESDREKKVKAEHEKVQGLLTSIDSEIGIEQQNYNKRKDAVDFQKKEEFSNKGADTKRLTEIEKKLAEIKAELEFIDENRDIVADYKKDKRDYLDRVEEFKGLKQKFEKQLEREYNKHQMEKQSIERELSVIVDLLKSLGKAINLIKEDNEAFNSFKELTLFKTIQEDLGNWGDEHKTDRRVKSLINELYDLENQKLLEKKDELRTTVTEYLGRFNDDNIFKFKKQLTDDKSFIEFALMLSDFVEENKIERIEKEVNERFALIVSTIATQTSSLVSNSGEIQKVIAKVNDDFEKKDFAGVIKKIELRIDESKNEIVQLLIMIKKYNDENAMDLGSANLFSGESQEKKNKEAVDLLKQFVKKISELKRDFVSLADSFELKFRIIENDNDSGWVEKLSNVGSEGTDVLVKAMLNIMLLNVFKEGASRKFKDFQLHCMMDEIGKLHPNNVRGILRFAKDRNIHFISGSPTENDALAFDHIYKLNKDEKSITRVKRILTQYSE